MGGAHMGVVWTLGHTAGIHSPLYVLLYPAFFAFALVFPPRIALPYAGVALVAYVGLVVIGSGVSGRGRAAHIHRAAGNAGLGGRPRHLLLADPGQLRREANASRAAFLEEI